MKNRQKYSTIILLLVLFCSFFTAYAKDDNPIPSYEITGAGTGSQGTYLINVTVISKKNNIDDNVIKRAAVHGVLFKGFSNKEHRQMQKPLAGSAANEAQHADFYKEFFGKNGTASTYGTVVAGSRSVSKLGKVYNISAIVQVQKEALMNYLQKAGVLRSLNSAF